MKRILCFFGRHALTQWRKTDNPPLGAYADHLNIWPRPPGAAARSESFNERHCKRAGCHHAQVKRVRQRKTMRPPMEADTVQGATKP